MGLLPQSPRLRRRLVRLGVVLGLGLAAAIVAVLVPSTNGNVKSHLSNEPAQRVVVERAVPVTHARRTQVNALFDAFVPAAVERRDPRTAYGLVTPAFRAGVTRKDWLAGHIPVYPYEPRGKTFHGWTVDTSYARTMSVELYLEPRNPKDGPVAVNVDLRRLRGRWLVDSYYPRASYAPAATAAETAHTGSRAAKPLAVSADERTHSTAMWILLVAFLVLVVATPFALIGAASLRGRRAGRRSGL